jgi:hypothetical protein
VVEYLQCEGRLFEVTLLAEVESDALATVECFEMGASGGLIGIIRDFPDGPITATLFDREDVPVAVLEWWIRIAMQGRTRSNDASQHPVDE